MVYKQLSKFEKDQNVVLIKKKKKMVPFFIFYFSLPIIGLMSRVFTNGPGDWGSILRGVIPKTKKKKKKKIVLDATLLNGQHFKVRIKGKVGQSREWSNGFPYTTV